MDDKPAGEDGELGEAAEAADGRSVSLIGQVDRSSQADKSESSIRRHLYDTKPSGSRGRMSRMRG